MTSIEHQSDRRLRVLIATGKFVASFAAYKLALTAYNSQARTGPWFDWDNANITSNDAQWRPKTSSFCRPCFGFSSHKQNCKQRLFSLEMEAVHLAMAVKAATVCHVDSELIEPNEELVPNGTTGSTTTVLYEQADRTKRRARTLWVSQTLMEWSVFWLSCNNWSSMAHWPSKSEQLLSVWNLGSTNDTVCCGFWLELTSTSLSSYGDQFYDVVAAILQAHCVVSPVNWLLGVSMANPNWGDFLDFCKLKYLIFY